MKDQSTNRFIKYESLPRAFRIVAFYVVVDSLSYPVDQNVLQLHGFDASISPA